jgi:uncharacterized lipoprotein YajG
MYAVLDGCSSQRKGFMKRLIFLTVAIFLLIGCVPSSGPADAARAAFVQWADTVNRVPYQNVQVATLENDGSFVTVKIAAELWR